MPVNQSELGGYKQQPPLTFLHASINKKQVEQVFVCYKNLELGNKKVVLYSLDCPFHLLGVWIQGTDRLTDRQLK